VVIGPTSARWHFTSPISDAGSGNFAPLLFNGASPVVGAFSGSTEVDLDYPGPIAPLEPWSVASAPSRIVFSPPLLVPESGTAG
jgi:hypothetical protein